MLHRLGTNDGAALRPSAFAQMRQGRAKALAHGVVRIVMKTLVLPEAIDFGSDRLLTASQAAEIRQCGLAREGGMVRTSDRTFLAENKDK